MIVENSLLLHPAPPLPALAVFADLENICGAFEQAGLAPDLAPIMVRLMLDWRPLVRRSFGDIASLPPMFSKHNVRRSLQKTYFSHEDVPHSAGQKNSADIRLIVAAMALAYQRPDITHFAILSGDRDFLPLVLHLRELGRAVIGVGPSRALVNEEYSGACDVFLYHEDIFAVSLPPSVAMAAMQSTMPPPEQVSRETAATNEETVKTLPDTSAALARLLEVLQYTQDQHQNCTASILASRMIAMFPDFKFKGIFGSFKQMCWALAKSGDIVLHDTDQANFTVLRATPMDTSLAIDAVGIVDNAAISQPLVEQYRQWLRDKLKIDIPTAAQRQTLYTALLEILAERSGMSITLSVLAQQAERQVSGTSNSAFRIFYGLYRARALVGTATRQTYNPNITGLQVAPDQLDMSFVDVTLKSFLRSDAGIPFDPHIWSLVFFGDTSRERDLAAIVENCQLAKST